MDIVRRKLPLVTIGTERVKQESERGLPAKKVAIVERLPLVEV